jgi:hypothetical protein
MLNSNYGFDRHHTVIRPRLFQRRRTSILVLVIVLTLGLGCVWFVRTRNRSSVIEL